MPVQCTCNAFQYNDGLCKHCLAVAAAPDAIDTANDDQADDTDTTDATAVTDGGTTTEPDETGETPTTDHWGHALQQFPDEPVGAGERCQCQACGERHEIAMVAATADTSHHNWEEFYLCLRCRAKGSFRFEGQTDRRTWTGRMDYPDAERRVTATV